VLIQIGFADAAEGMRPKTAGQKLRK